jgi:DNA-binding transcriptional MerR regulator
MKLKIGDFARIGQVTVQTLRHYDDLGLLHPARVDALSSYRYYTLDQLPRLHRILALKDLGFSLEQVNRLLEENLPFEELRGMLRLKQAELRNHIQEQLDRLDHLEARLHLIEQENQLPQYEIILKRVEPLRVASVRRIIPSYWDEGPLWVELFKQLGQSSVTITSPCMTVYHAGEPEIDAEACAPLPPQVKRVRGLRIRTLPAVETTASLIHQGSFAGLANAYGVLLQWIDANGYSITGPDRAIYLRLPEEGKSQHDPNAITEMQVPICKE